MYNIVDKELVEAMANGLASHAWDKNRRYDSNSVEDIGLLYGVKLDGNEKPVAERAHPETCVIAPAYDGMNGVVENLYERQNVMKYVADKTPNGNLTQRRYVSAYNELMNSLIRTGFRMDDDGNMTLMKLSDSCANRLNKNAKLEKIAIEPITVGLLVAGGISAILGISALINRTSNTAQGVSNDCVTVNKELSDLQGQPGVSEMIEDVDTLKAKAEEFAALGTIQIKSADHVIDMVKNPPPQLKVGEDYVFLLQQIDKKIPGWIEEIQASATAISQSSRLPDWMAKIRSGVEGILSITDDATDAINALEGLQKSVETAVSGVRVIMAKAKTYEPSLNQLMAQREQEQRRNPESQTAPTPEDDKPLIPEQATV